MITTPLSAQPSPRVAALLKKTQAVRNKLIFALDATASREPTWDMAAKLTAEMFEQASRIGGLDVSLLFFRGHDQVWQSPWYSDAHELISRMSEIKCSAGATKIARMLRHIKAEQDREKINAVVFVGDAIEERPSELYDAVAGLGVPVFMFQEGDNTVIHLDQRGEFVGEYPPLKVEQVFREISRLSGGAYGKFDAGAAKVLGEMLNAVVAYAVGGMTALADQRTDSARRLLGQMK
jgi:hypothetical protein